MRPILAAILATAAFAADPDGAALYQEHCAMCHDHSAETRAPAPSALKMMSPENVVKALESGLMKDQGAPLAAAQKKTVAEFLTGKMIGAQQAAVTEQFSKSRLVFGCSNDEDLPDAGKHQC